MGEEGGTRGRREEENVKDNEAGEGGLHREHGVKNGLEKHLNRSCVWFNEKIPNS